MNILLVHNYYRAATPSGENIVFEAEAALLESAGHRVERFTRSNDEIADAPLSTVLTATLRMASNPRATAQLRRTLQRFQPDVVHFHNTFPLLSPALLAAAREYGAAVVATLHNYRTVCAQGGLLREGRICTECLDRRDVWPGLRHGCYQGRFKSLFATHSIAHHRRAGTWREVPHALIVLTEFQQGLMERSGIPAQGLRVKPNFTAATQPIPWSSRDDHVIFVGRLFKEKGVWTLLEAWRALGTRAPRLKIVGSGVASAAMQRRVVEWGLSQKVEFLGVVPHAQAMDELARARLLIFPSLWYEPFGMALIEAYARAVPVLASRLGSLPAIVHENQTGALFPPGDASALAQAVSKLLADPAELERLGANALVEWERNYCPERNLAQLEAIYRDALVARNTA